MAGMVKAFNLSFEYVLYRMSYPNVILYSATLPTYNADHDQPGRRGYNSGEQALDITHPDTQNKIDKFIDSLD